MSDRKLKDLPHGVRTIVEGRLVIATTTGMWFGPKLSPKQLDSQLRFIKKQQAGIQHTLKKLEESLRHD